MLESYATLPSDYTLTRTIDMQQNKRDMFLLNIGSVVLFLVVVFLWIALFGTMVMDMAMIIILFGLFALNIIVHELIHALFFKLGGHDTKVRFKFHGFAASASVPTRYYQKAHYIIIGLAPFMILLGVYVLLAVAAHVWLARYWIDVAGFLMALHISGCIGDYYVTAILSKMPPTTLINGCGIGMRFYIKEDQK